MLNVNEKNKNEESFFSMKEKKINETLEANKVISMKDRLSENQKLWVYDKEGYYKCSVDGIKYKKLTENTVSVLGVEEEIKSEIELISEIKLGKDIYKVKSIESFAFHSNSNLESIIIAEGIEKIGWVAFYNCTNLKNVKLPMSLKFIDDSAFEKCSSITKIDIPNNVEYIGDEAFEGCGLGSLIIPEKISKIGFSAFKDCRNLVNLTINNKNIQFYFDSFEGCSKLSNVKLAGVNC